MAVPLERGIWPLQPPLVVCKPFIESVLQVLCFSLGVVLFLLPIFLRLFRWRLGCCLALWVLLSSYFSQ